MSHYWLAVASANHVQIGLAGGFMQVCHGRCAPLRHIQPGDWVVYYSPTLEMGGKTKVQAFTAIGIVRAGIPYPVQMGDDFFPFRRDVDWFTAQTAPIQPLLSQLAFTAGRKNWGYALRFGLLQISEPDMALLAAAMQAPWPNAKAHS